MIGTAPAVIFDSFPWWIARPILYVLVLGTGMALDETYVNRTTVLAGALALSIHSLTTGGVWAPLGLYLDVGLVLGVYGLYAYVVDAYVPGWFRAAAFMLYSPLSIALILLFPDIIFFVSLLVAGYANLQLLATLHPVEPYYFGPESPDASARAASAAGTPDPVERADGSVGGGLGRIANELGTLSGTSSDEEPAQSTTSSADERDARQDSDRSGVPPDDRGVLPAFMRRL
ncbi:hypothetical protein C479_01011 [Halovivax asiaticus JCM 14624]|uniref:Uncharacterized protein n=1 Tax=Halovivax asiaticus JCM 14624 TaxID=1227490 RepID=M0BV55_9EURY|nr:hypothetical protein [Halovivax asiaticus]ELZ13987.1 hypothetical protein C479_01011 [Halovivax asiaticus JCM 14624]